MATKKKTVLIIEDEQIIVDLLKMYLEEVAGFYVVTALNGQEGLREYHKTQPDLILLDLQMPVMDGYTFLSKLRAQGATVPVIIVSSCWQFSKHQAYEIGADAWVSKPFSLSFLHDKINEIIDQDEQTLNLIRSRRKIIASKRMQVLEGGEHSDQQGNNVINLKKRNRVLIIQHDKKVLDNISLALRKEGYLVSQMLLDDKSLPVCSLPDHDLVILSIQDFNYTALQRIKSRVPVIITSPNSNEMARRVGYIFGADEWLVSPVDYEELGSFVDELLSKSYAELQALRTERIISFIQESALGSAVAEPSA